MSGRFDALLTMSMVASATVSTYQEHDRIAFTTYCVRVTGNELEPDNDDDDQFYEIVMHSNGIGLVRLSASHMICRAGERITAVHLSDAVQNLKCVGKSKKQCKKFTKPSDRICTIDVQTPRSSTIRSIPIHNCMFGKLVEINAKLLANPVEFFRNSHSNREYLAIIYLDCGPSRTLTYRDRLVNYLKKQPDIEIVSIRS